MTLSARLVHASGAVPLLAWGERLGWGRGYLVHIRPFDLAGPEGLPVDAVAAAARINAAMEQLIAECPQQYLWSYNRYKHPA
jgi:KDO2-lipid IV(A) lauroyltransferase